jgi:hypothetical protein
MRGKSQAEIAALIRRQMQKDVLAQQKKVAAADALAVQLHLARPCRGPCQVFGACAWR